MPQRMFLERRSYRMRRMMDAVRLLPFLGLALCMVPLLWPLPEDGGETMPKSSALLYLFGIWMALVCAGWTLWWRTGRGTYQDGTEVDDPARTNGDVPG